MIQIGRISAGLSKILNNAHEQHSSGLYMSVCLFVCPLVSLSARAIARIEEVRSLCYIISFFNSKKNLFLFEKKLW